MFLRFGLFLYWGFSFFLSHQDWFFIFGVGISRFFLFCFLRSFVVQFLCSETVCYFVFDMKNRRSFNNIVSNLCCHSSIVMGKVEKLFDHESSTPKGNFCSFSFDICVCIVCIYTYAHTHMYIVRLSPQNATHTYVYCALISAKCWY